MKSLAKSFCLIDMLWSEYGRTSPCLSEVVWWANHDEYDYHSLRKTFKVSRGKVNCHSLGETLVQWKVGEVKVTGETVS
ncbi:hypothetical protein F2Q70_00000955 [Brassica cretica]|uniref:Uncharacterized protein n=1 Tax=Brassica cretica TaxID=69181 RepID=A0A8S9J2T9_BRACR|nr:hypothetical protein F2Q70_00000955 [Brassica cretica]